MNYSLQHRFLKNLPKKLNNLYNKNKVKSLNVKNKSKKNKLYDPVTNFDKLFEKFVRSLIKKNFSKDGIIGEEFLNKKSENSFMWSIDPIDGTRAFVMGIPTWSNLISVSENGIPKIGLANFPELDRYYISDKNRSYVFKRNKKILLRSSKIFNLKKIKIIGNFHGKLFNIKKNEIIKRFGLSLRLASLDALSYCLLAEGKVDVVIESNLKQYDILPLIPIIEKSGGFVTTWKNERPEMGGNILATSNFILHKKILSILKTLTNK